MSSKYPFELPPEEYEEIILTPSVVAAMDRGEESEQLALSKIHDHWEKRAAKATAKNETQPVYGIKIRKNFGFSGPEGAAQEKQRDRQAIIARKSMVLMRRIAVETGLGFQEVQALLVELQETNVIPNMIEPYADEAFELADLANPIEDNVLYATTYLRRAIHNWTTEDTISLHPSIRESLDAFHIGEVSGPGKKSEP